MGRYMSMRVQLHGHQATLSKWINGAKHPGVHFILCKPLLQVILLDMLNWPHNLFFLFFYHCCKLLENISEFDNCGFDRFHGFCTFRDVRILLIDELHSLMLCGWSSRVISSIHADSHRSWWIWRALFIHEKNRTTWRKET